MPEPTHADLLRDAIARSGFSNRAFACMVLMRDERTVRRWLSGKHAIPQEVLASRWLRDIEPPPDTVLEWLAGA